MEDEKWGEEKGLGNLMNAVGGCFNNRLLTDPLSTLDWTFELDFPIFLFSYFSISGFRICQSSVRNGFQFIHTLHMSAAYLNLTG
jgi:hypothetical protein